MKKVIILLLAVLLILGSGMCGDALGNAMAEGPEETVRLTYYKSVRIRTGDTLWDLAEQYAPDTDLTIAQYVEKLRQMNSLKDDTIHAGNYLTVMYQEVKSARIKIGSGSDTIRIRSGTVPMIDRNIRSVLYLRKLI